MKKIQLKSDSRMIYLLSFLTAMGMFCIICLVGNIYPFGTKSNLAWDASIQYADFFAFLRDLLFGDAHIGYSMSKSLGGSLVAFFAYYLSSPLNLLVIFFKRENLQLFIFIITLLKVSLSAFTCCFYLKNRFKHSLDNRFVIVLSLAYAFSQYSVSQATNIMWLDGVYMLPLMMFGVWKFVSKDRPFTLWLTVGLTVLFNWYTGYMNCLFIPFYFLVEEVLFCKNENNLRASKVICRSLRFCLVEFLGVLLSSVLLLPTVYGLLNGKGIEDSNLFVWQTNGTFLDMLRGFVLGSEPNSPQISIYCGCAVLIAVVCFFFNKRIKIFEKVWIGGFALFLCIGLLFKPMENIWNGFRYVYSYYYRFSYVVIAGFIFIAAYFLSRGELSKKNTFMASGAIILLFLLMDGIKAFNSKYLFVTVALIALYPLLLIPKRRLAAIALVSLTIVELILNAKTVVSKIYTAEASAFPAYMQEEELLVSAVQRFDSGLYRMEQTFRRHGAVDANGAMSAGYKGIAHYSSTFDENVAKLYCALGYSDQESVNFYKEPILPADSLFGVKYILSDKSYAGYEAVEEIDTETNKSAWYNPYALPLAFSVSDKVVEATEADNCFEKINRIYSAILGREIKLFEKVEYEKNILTDSVEYKINADGTENILYGFAGSNTSNLKLYVDGDYVFYYSGWLLNYVFNIGTQNAGHTIVFQGTNAASAINEVFYSLNIDLFEACIHEIRSGAVSELSVDDGHIAAEYTADKDGQIMLTVPYSDSWSVSVNGKEVKPEVGLGTFITIPVCAGNNTIELNYHVPWLLPGVALSLISVAVFIILSLLKKRKYGKA